MVPLLQAGIAHYVNARANAVAIAAMAPEAEAHPMVVAGRGVSKQLRPAIQARDHGIDASVAVEIAECEAAMLSQLLKARTCFRRDIGKGVALLVLQHQISLRIALHVASGDQDILVAIVVQVEYSGTPPVPPDRGTAKPAAIRHILESPLADIPEERKSLPGKRRHKQIFPAVVVVVAEIGAHGGDRLAVII